MTDPPPLPIRLSRALAPPHDPIIELEDGTFWFAEDNRIWGGGQPIKLLEKAPADVPKMLVAHFFNYPGDCAP